MNLEQNSKGVRMRTKRVVITDTNAIILLLRIAPEMFQDARFGCVLPEYAYQEFIMKPEFKVLFPWRERYKRFLNLGVSILDAQKHPQFPSALKTISLMSRIRPNRYGKYYGLSKKDQEILSVAVAFGYDLCTEDRNLALFARDEFDVRVFSALSLINRWIQDKLITWDDEKQALLADWGDRKQPKKEVGIFQSLTGYTYPA